jgi:hypothetical protein
VKGRALFRSRRALRLGERTRLLALEDPEIFERNVLERVGGYAEVGGQYVGRCVSDPVGEQQRVEFGRHAVIEREQEFSPACADTLQRVRQPGREVPEIASLHILNRRPAFFVEHGNAAFAVEHDCPLGLLVPVHFADAACRKPHVHAGNILRYREVRLSDFPRPAAILDALVRIVERRPEKRQAVDVGGRRILERRELICQCGILGAGIGEPLAIQGVDCAFWRPVRVAERCSSCCDCHAGRHGRSGRADQHFASSQIRHAVSLSLVGDRTAELAWRLPDDIHL